MATRIDLDKAIVKAALEQRIGSLKRQVVNSENVAIKELLEKDIALVQAGINTMAEVK